MEALADDAFHEIDDLLRTQEGAINDDRIGGWLHGGNPPGGVAGVAFGLGPDHFFERHGLPGGTQLAVPPPRSFLRPGHEKELAFRIGEDHGPLIAAFRHQVAAGGVLALQLR